jgi:hypothetical protein
LPSAQVLIAGSAAPAATSARCRIEGLESKNVDGTTVCDGPLGLGRFELPVWLAGLHGLSWDASTPDEAGLVHWPASLLVVWKLEFHETPTTKGMTRRQAAGSFTAGRRRSS